MNIYLDDLRIPAMSHNISKGLGSEYSKSNKWIIVRDYFEFIKIIDENFDKIQLISFDHDLACYKDNVEFTGKTASDYLINYCIEFDKKFPNWYVHTDNVNGRKNIIGSILSYLKVIEKYNFDDFRYFHSGILNGKFV